MQMIIFDHLIDKELFEVKHSAELASRFLCNKMDKKAEMEMVAKLTVHEIYDDNDDIEN